MSRRWAMLFAIVGIVTMVFAPLVAQAQGQSGAGGANPATSQISALLGTPNQTSPQNTQPNELNNLNSADPASGISTIDPPAANDQGAARLSYPIVVPPGRAGTQPNLSITYDSSNADGWLGLGWDLSTQAIAVDTRWGVPRYDKNQESESYDYDGTELTPLAHTGSLPARESPRTFHQRIEGNFYTITRYGTDPTNYYWEVIDQSGTEYFFGATNSYDSKGNLVATLDPSQVLAAPVTGNSTNPGAIYKWPLTQVLDFNNNVTTYHYDLVNDPVVPGGSITGSQLYLASINYDGSNTGSALVPGPYNVTFARTSTLDNGSARPDILSDARGGFLTVTAQLLSTITVAYNGQTIRSYGLSYGEGAFDKTLLQSIKENGANGTFLDQHSFTYYNNVKGSNGSINGFSSSTTWDTGQDNPENSAIPGLQDPSALSGAFANSYDGHLYLGFDPLDPSKDTSVGVSVNYNHIDSQDTLAMIDINGDGLPDKVFEQDGGVWYRLNQSAPGPNSTTTFGPAEQIASLSSLAQETSDSVGVGPEAYLGASVLYNHSWTFTKSPIYFIDMNNDGLPDLVQNGSVLFDHLDGGVPSFSGDSSTTAVPIGQSQVDAAPLLPGLQSAYQQELAASPLVDTVRRWTAPYDGTISITGGVNLIQDTSAARKQYTTADGVTVAIQHNGTQLWSAQIGESDYAVKTPSGVDAISVKAGDRIYFRVESGFDGKYDQVNWDPAISYTGVSAASDANGLSVYTFQESKDFTIAGRQGMSMTMPYDGTVSIGGLLQKTGTTSDDVTLQVLQNGKPVSSQTLAWSKTGAITPPSSLSVKKGDTIALHVEIDSRVDLSKISWDPSLYYTQATDASGNTVPVTDGNGNYDIQLNPPYSMDVYPLSSIAQPDTGQSMGSGTITVTPSTPGTVASPLAGSPTGNIVFTVKTTNQLLAKETLSFTKGLVSGCTIENPSDGSVTNCASNQWQAVTADISQSEPVFFDFSILDHQLSDDITSGDVSLGNGAAVAVPVHGTYDPTKTMDKGLFAQPYRGWGVAGYNGGDTSSGAAIDESKLVIDTSDYPTPSNYYHPDLKPDAEGYPTQNYDSSTGFTNAAGNANPIKATAWPMSPMPAHLDTLANPPVQVPDEWMGPKNEIWARASSTSSSRLTQDYVSVPSAQSFAGASAVTQFAETQQDSIAGGLLSASGSYSWGASDGILDEIDMNGDGFPDVVGQNSIQYTNSVGTLDSSATTEDLGGDVRESHSMAYSLGASGNPAKFTSDAKGDTNAPEQAQSNSGTAKKASSSESGSSEAGAEPAGKSNAAGSRPASSSGAAGSSSAAPESAAADAASESSATSKKGASSAGGSPDGDPPETDSGGGQELSLGVSGQYAHSETNHNSDHAVGGTLVNSDLVDVNGDGLPDRVSTYSDGSMMVAFNLGYAFAPAVEWSSDAVTQSGSSDGFTIGADIGFNDGIYGFGGGVSGGKETDNNNEVMVDMNGDGLPDLLTERGGNLYVAINTGDGFAPAVQWNGAIASNIATSTNVNLGGGAYFTISIPTCVIVEEPACYIIINPGFDYTRTMSRQELDLRDINGDGYPDDLSSTSNSSMEVALNNTGDTNLLESVSRPLGSSFTIDYTREGNTTADPYSVWTMSKVTVNDNTPAQSANTQVTTYSYANNYYNRDERQVYGYDTVTTNQLDPSSGAVYRSFVDTYANDNYYDAGLLLSEKIMDGSGNIYVETDNSYTLLDVASGQSVTGAQAASDTLDTIFPELSKTTQSYFWGQASPGKTTTASYEYDARGNTTKITDSGDGPANATTASVQYVDCPSVNVFNVPTSLTVSDASGNVLRHQTATVPCSEGAPTQIFQYLANGQSSETDIAYYDGTGQHWNTKSITLPPNLNGQKYSVNYSYDPATLTYVTGTQDSFGYTSTATYNPLFGTIASSTDINGNTTNYGYDEFGRLTSVTGPDQQGTGKPTLTYEYHPCVSTDSTTCTSPSWAEVHAIDTLHGGTLDYVNIVDGLDRTIETKHNATVFTGASSPPSDVMVVSGRVTFDFLGRVIQQYYPTTEPLGTPGAFNATYDSQPPATSAYDVLDRLTQAVAPSGATTTYAYGFGADRSGATQFETTETDALGNKTATFTDVRQQVTSVDMFNGNQQVWTSYAYNPLNQMTSVTDDQNNVTTIAYDNLGREVSYDNPDSGLTTMTYDPASNLIAKVTANLRQEGKNQAIQYNYDYTHLTQINYPNFTGNDVAYTYGGPGAASNGAGRVVNVTDQAGQQAYSYGKMGAVVSEADTINPIRAQQQVTYTTSFSYDTWNRLHTLTYPDGEVVTYGYDSGGLVNSVSGVAGTATYPYVNTLQYNKFGLQALLQDGNGVQTQYSYTPTMQRLDNIQSGNGSGLFQNESYSYDAVGNVLSEKNDIPVPSAGTFGGPSSQTYSYDHLYRLTGATGTYQFAPDKTQQYTLSLSYDSLGDILTNSQSDTITQPGGSTQTLAPTTHDWTYGYTGPQPNAVTQLAGAGTLPGKSNGKGSGHAPESGITYSYDANGNETGWKDNQSGQRRTIVWDEENRVQSIANNGQTTSFRYDDQGNRVVTVGPGGVTTNVNQYYTVINGQNAIKNIFVGDQRIAQQGVQNTASGPWAEYFYHQDLTGSTAYVTDASGNLFQHLDYFPTGETWVDEVSDPHVIPYKFTSHSFDSVTQLYYYGARYYDPRLAQFISPDPALASDPEETTNDPMLLDPYTYVDNNPVRYIDTNGLALTSAQQSFLHSALSAPAELANWASSSAKIIKAQIREQLPVIELPGSTANQKKVIKGFTSLANLKELPPLIEVGFKDGSVHEIKIVKVFKLKKTARH